jgi:hypothetical protein
LGIFKNCPFVVDPECISDFFGVVKSSFGMLYMSVNTAQLLCNYKKIVKLLGETVFFCNSMIYSEERKTDV